MNFIEWLKANWDKLRKNTKYFSGEKYKDLDLVNNYWWIDYSNEKPLDSWDRLFALYLIDVHPECLDKTWDEVKDLEDIKDFSIDSYEGSKAYDNYEREWISNEDAWRKMIEVAKQGRDAVLIDSYEDGGWFGAA